MLSRQKGIRQGQCVYDPIFEVVFVGCELPFHRLSAIFYSFINMIQFRMHLCHYEKCCRIFLFKHFQIKARVNIEREILLLAVFFRLLQQKVVKIFQNCLLREIFGMFTNNLINFLSFQQVIKTFFTFLSL